LAVARPLYRDEPPRRNREPPLGGTISFGFPLRTFSRCAPAGSLLAQPYRGGA